MANLPIISRPQEPSYEDWDAKQLDIEILAKEAKVTPQLAQLALLNFEQPFLPEKYCTHIKNQLNLGENVVTFRISNHITGDHLGVIFVEKPIPVEA